MWVVNVGFLCGYQGDASHISTEPCICRRKMSEEVTDMPWYYLLLAGSSEAYLLLAGSSVKLIFIGWLLLRTACKPCRAEVEEGGGTARTTGTNTDSSITSVGKTHNPVSTFRTRETQRVNRESQLSPCLTSSLSSLLLPSPLVCHCFDLMTHYTLHVTCLANA